MIEEMSAFFAARVEGYDEHMLKAWSWTPSLPGSRTCASRAST